MAKTNTTEFKQMLVKSRFRGLWGLLAGFRLIYVGAIVALGISTVARTMTFFLIGYLVDKVLGQINGRGGVAQPGPLGGITLPLLTVALGFIALALVQGSFTFTSGTLAARTAEGVTRRMRNYLYDHIQRLSFAYHDRMPTGDLIQRATSDVDAVRRFFAEQAIGVGRILLLFIVNWIALWQFNVQLALASVVVIPVILVISVFFFRRISRIYQLYQEQDAKLSTTLQENLTGVRVVKAFARQQYEEAKFERDNVEKYRRGRRLMLQHATFWPVTDTLCSAQLVAGFTIGALMTINGALTLGDYVAYIGLVGLCIWPMRELGRVIVQASQGVVSFGRLMEIVQEEREPLEEGQFEPRPEARVHGAIEFHNVGFGYASDSHVLHDVSFRVEPGQVVALLGPTGSGKTSLVNLLPRFYEYSRGSVTLDGVELKHYPRQFLRQQIGIVEQEPFLFSRTIRENITYGVGREVTEAEVQAAAQAASIHDVILSFPEGYNTLVGEKGITLSGGQKQRVAIARTVLKDPRILILDDSTSAVDTETESAIREALEELMQGRTTFVIAHRIQSVMNADLILVLENGRITQRGKHHELVAQDGLYRRIYDLQARIEVEVEREVDAAAPSETELEEAVA